MRGRGMPPGALLVAGILISITAFSVLNFTPTENPQAMKLFLYIGVGFIVIASIQMLIKSRKQIAVKEKEFASKLAQPTMQQPKKIMIVNCRVCNTRNYSTSNYCHMCGAKLQ